MRTSFSRWQIAGFLFTSLAGTLLHFVYDWSGQGVLAALISPVNESIWEHMKLLYYPMVVFSLVENHYVGSIVPNFWCRKLLGLLVGLSLIPGLYYLYTGIFGVSLSWVDVSIFFLAAAAAFWVETRTASLPCHSRLAIAGIVLIGVLFVALTFFPPHIPLFQDPIRGGYGIL